MPEPIVMPEWVNTTFSEETRKDPLFVPKDDGSLPDMARYKTPDDFFKSYKTDRELVGRKGVIIPTDKSTPEEMESFWNAIGRPEKPDGYKFTDVKDVHPALKVSPESQKSFSEFLHKTGVPAKHADAFHQYVTGWLSDAFKASDKAFAENQTKAVAELKAAWGDKYDTNLKSASTLVEKVGGKDAIAAFGDLANNPKVLMFLSKLGSVISEDSISRITLTGGSQVPEQEAALKQIEEIKADAKADRKHPMNDEKHADHRKWAGVDGLWTKLNQTAYKPSA